jgi:hypothetical protein
MKKLIVILLISTASQLQAQNVGIGTTSPTAKLDVVGSTALRGSEVSSFFFSGLSEDTYIRGGKINSTVYINDHNGAGAVFIGTRLGIGVSSARAAVHLSPDLSNRKIILRELVDDDHEFYGLGTGIDMTRYQVGNTSSSHVFFAGINSVSSAELMRIKGNGNVGIGESNPGFRLNFSSTAGDKISLYGNSGAHYGFGIQGSLLQIHSAGSGDDIAFGYGSSNAFTERMRIKGNGNVGIGIIDPAYVLDVGSRMRIRSTTNNSAGLWLNNAANDISPAFIGMQNDNTVGLFGSGSGWAFTMNTQNGAISLGGNTGSAGQVLQSNGSGSAANWVSPTNQLFNNMYEFGATTAFLSTAGNTFDLPGLNQNITLSQTSKVLVSMHVAGRNEGCGICGNANLQYLLYIDGATGTNYFQYKGINVPPERGFNEDTGCRMLTLGPGVHNFKMVVEHSGGPNVQTYTGGGPFGTRMLIIVVPQ